jgi:putative SOS response-associated peptidase YedK
MCGRYTLIANAEAIRLLFELPEFDERLVVPRYNIAPTQPIAVVREGPKGRELVPVRWGLIPWWARDPKTLPLMINARAEGIAEKPAYRDPFKYRRCLVPASGFYEWKARGKGPKQPYLASPGDIHEGDGRLIAFAGLWETWHGPDGSEIDTATIVTTNANAPLGEIHGRMPVVVAAKDFETWLSMKTQPAEADALLKPAPDDLFSLTPVSTRVNSADNDDPSLIAESSEEPAEAPKRASPKRAAPDPRQRSLF